MIIRRNRAQCLICGEILESKYVTDRRICGCGSLSIDGGQSFLGRYCYSDKAVYKELSEIIIEPEEEVTND